MDLQRQLLDELMGKERDVAPEERQEKKKRNLTDPDVDIYHLCGCSPYELFTNTKSDLGANPKVPDEDLKKEWDALSQEEKDKYGFEYDTMKFLQRIVENCDRKIEKNKQRVEQDADLSRNDRMAVNGLDRDIRLATEQAIAVGDTDKAKVEELNQRIAELNGKRQAIIDENNAKKKLTVCEVSGNLLSTADSRDRLKAHYVGKQYKGWAMVREKLKELQAKNPPPRYGRFHRDDPPRDHRDYSRRDSSSHHRREASDPHRRGDYRDGRRSDYSRRGRGRSASSSSRRRESSSSRRRRSRSSSRRRRRRRRSRSRS